MTTPLPIAVLYAGLAGTLLALVVATAQQRWSPRVFFLLALRLAIGWHFLFEGLYKVHSVYTGPTDTNRPFTSEPYFRVAPGPVGAYMRKQFENPEEVLAAKVKRGQDVSPEAFARLSAEDQAAACPRPVAEAVDGMEESAQKAVKAEAERDAKAAAAAEAKAVQDANEAEAKGLKDPKADAAKVKADADKARAKAKADAEKARADAAKKGESFKEAGKALVTAAKASYARWVYGVDGRPANLKVITGRDTASGEVMLTAPQRLAHLDWLRGELKAGEARQGPGLGAGYGTDAKRLAELRTNLLVGETELARDATAFVAELRKDLNGGKAVEEEKPVTTGQRMDIFTMWFLVAVGTCLLAGLFTPLACVLGAGFLVITYLTHPAVPWHPLPPNTEGNPLFVNKNVIECLALLVVATFPTGRWMGVDALLSRLVRGRREEPAA